VNAYLVKWKMKKRTFVENEGIDSVYALSMEDAEEMIRGRIVARMLVLPIMKDLKVEVIETRKMKE